MENERPLSQGDWFEWFVHICPNLGVGYTIENWGHLFAISLDFPDGSVQYETGLNVVEVFEAIERHITNYVKKDADHYGN